MDKELARVLKVERQRQEVLHRATIQQLNHAGQTGSSLGYYKDSEIDSDILPIVRDLNNYWAFTTFSCGGHWHSDQPSQYPYVSFCVFNRPREWARITASALKFMQHQCGDDLSIFVSESRCIHEDPVFVDWKFEVREASVGHGTPPLLRNERAFRIRFRSLFRILRAALSRAEIAESRRCLRQSWVRFARAFKAQLAEACPMTAEDLQHEEAPKTCMISGEPFEPGDTALYLNVPTSPAPDCETVRCLVGKKSVLENLNWRYIPLAPEEMIPVAVEWTDYFLSQIERGTTPLPHIDGKKLN